MENLEQLLSEKLGISPEMAHKAVLIVADYLRTKLPVSMSKELELVLKLPTVTEEEAKELGLFKIP